MHNASGHHQTSSPDVTRGVRLSYSRPLNLPLLSVPERLDLLCRTDREVALRAAARYIDLLLHHLVNVHVCAFSLILLLKKGHRCSAGYLRNQ